jgi:predicted glycoside hydrolase/deacetylase ChbG (UPF0249 family)
MGKWLLLLTVAVAVLLVSEPVRAEEIRLIVRGDDLGMTQGSLIAFEKGFNEGILTCGSIIVPAPWFEAVADLAKKNPRWCLGVHLTLVGEWIGYRWRPVLPWNRVKSIVDEDGFLYTCPRELFQKRPRLEDIDAELRAQIELARKKGVRVSYLDTHYMSIADYPGLADLIQKIGKDFALPISGLVGERRLRGVYRVPIEEKEKKAIRMLEGLHPGLWLWVSHIGIEWPEQDALVHSAVEDRFDYPGVGAHRAAELEVILSPEVKAVIKEKGIKLIDYRKIRG